MAIITDPELLLLEYNKAANELISKGKPAYIFDSKLATDIYSLGQVGVLE